jgi:hypothetical protein
MLITSRIRNDLNAVETGATICDGSGTPTICVVDEQSRDDSADRCPSASAEIIAGAMTRRNRDMPGLADAALDLGFSCS